MAEQNQGPARAQKENAPADKSQSVLQSECLHSTKNTAAQRKPYAATKTETQRQEALEMLRLGPKTTDDFRAAGIYTSPARIFELRHRFGYEIDSVRINMVDRDGFPRKAVALYSLVSEPEPARQGQEQEGGQQ